MADIPHFSLPFRFVPRGDGTLEAATTEQDSSAEVADCVEATVRTVKGERLGMPDFGRRDAEFALHRDQAREQLQAAIEDAEPRARHTVEADTLDSQDQGLLRLRTFFETEEGET